ncbi:MAG: PKD domain-containing protein, partial [Bacteroidota bacterium]
NLSVSPAVTTTYYGRWENGCGNSTCQTVTITVNPLPVAPTSVNATLTAICEGSGTSLTYTGGSGDTFEWYTGSCGGTAIGTGNNLNVSPTVTTTYYGRWENGCGNSTCQAITITVNVLPTVDAGVDQVVCDGTPVVLSGSGATTYTWDNGVIDGISFTPAVGTLTYTVTGTTNGCSNTDQVEVTVNALPTVDAGVDQVTCDGSPVTLSGSGADSYTWDNSVLDGIPFIPAVGTITYTVTGTTNGCSNTDQVEVTVYELPTVDAGVDQVVCDGTSVTLSGDGADSYTWDNGVLDGISFTPAVGTLTYTVTGTTNGCSNTDQVIVTVNEIPTASVSVVDASCGLSDGSATVSASGGTGTYTYLWSDSLSQVTETAITLGIGTYYVTVDDGNCSFVTSAFVSENGAPIITVNTTDTTVCEGQSVILTVSGADSYLWTPSTFLDNDTASVVVCTPGISTTYTITGTTNNCSAQATIIVNYSPLPIAGYSVVDNGFGNISLTDLSQNATTWSWDFGDGGTDFVQNPTYTYLTSGIYTITQTVQNACGFDTSTQIINVIVDNINSVLISSQLEIYPNPSNGNFNLKYTSNTNDFVISVISIHGQEVYSKGYSKNTPSTTIPIDFTKFAKGVYQIKVTSGDVILNARMVIDRL